MLINKHSGMIVSSFIPDYKNTLDQQVFNGNEKTPLNGAGVITIIRVKESNSMLVLASGKLNPANRNFENSLALGGGFNFLNGGIKNNTFISAVNASINFKAPAYPLLDENQLAPAALVGYCEQWGNMQYATLHRIIDVETADDAKNLVISINEANIKLGKSEQFGLYDLDDVLRSAELTSQLEEDNQKKGQVIKEANLVITDLVTNARYDQFVIFDDLATDALNKLILHRPLSSDAQAKSMFGFFADKSVTNETTEPGVQSSLEKK